MEWKKRIYCGDISHAREGNDVLLMGWVDAIRDHGNLIFVHLRDTRGIVQIVFDPNVSKESFEKASVLREEYVIEIIGKVSIREKGTENPFLETGDLEIFVFNIIILSKSKILPFPISEKAMLLGEEIRTSPENVDEDLRLRHRYLDLRRPSVQEMFKKRDGIIQCVREYLHGMNFIEVETPFLTKSTPEGARDYLVPSRVHHGKFYALPQSPQLFKQLLMMGGMDRYFQIARCFRDEDLRPNRQPEFTQLDMEASFIDEEFIYQITEELTARIFAAGGIQLPRPFPSMTYQEAMDQYGTDRPDLRFGMEFEDLTSIFKDTEYGIFRKIISKVGRIKGFCVKGHGDFLSKNILQNEYTMKIAPSFGAKGMSWMKVLEGRLNSNIVQFFKSEELDALKKIFRAREGDVLIMIGDESTDLVNKILCSLRLHIAERLDLPREDLFRPLWVTNFPLFEMKEDGLVSKHHPFTMPDRTDFNQDDPEDLLSLNSRAYDLVMNGEELGGGSIRIHSMEVQNKIFQALGMNNEEIEMKFGFFLRALEYGAPPHGGLALGMDRVVSMVLKAASIRDVIAFPKNRRAFCPLTGAPSLADPSQLLELGISFSGESGSQEVQAMDAGSIIHKKAMEQHPRISREQVRHVARLARLRIPDSEVAQYQEELNRILEYAETLEEVDTSLVDPLSHVLEIKNVWREDISSERGEGKDLLKNAPEREKDYFKVPRIL